MPRYEDVWRMHCEGMAVPAIARELRIDPELARAIIVERWAEDKAERIAVGLKAVRGWEDE